MGRCVRTLGLILLSLGAACVINTRPHLPGEDNQGRVGVTGDAGASSDAAFAGGAGDAAAYDSALAPDGAPPTATPDASADDGGQNAEFDDCLPVGTPRGDGGVHDGGDAGSRPDGGDAGFTDSKGRACEPRARGRDGGGADATDGRSS